MLAPKSSPLQNEVLAKVFHDFNNVVSVLLLNMEILEDQGSKNDKAKDRVGKIRAALGRLRFIAQHLKVTSGLAQETTYDLLLVINDLESELQKAFPHLEIQKKLSGGSTTIQLDPWLLKNLFVFIAREISEQFQPRGRIVLEVEQRPTEVLISFKAHESAKTHPGISGSGVWIENLAKALQIDLKISLAADLQIDLKIPLFSA